jgi:hypothetical protein
LNPGLFITAQKAQIQEKWQFYRLSEAPLLILLGDRQSKDYEINLLKSRVEILEDQLDAVKETQKSIQERNQVCTVGVSPNFKITVACGLKFYWYLRTLSLKFQEATSRIEVFQSLPCLASNLQPNQRRERNTSILLAAF